MTLPTASHPAGCDGRSTAMVVTRKDLMEQHRPSASHPGRKPTLDGNRAGDGAELSRSSPSPSTWRAQWAGLL